MSVRLRHWAALKTTDFAALDAERCVAVLPAGAVEQHGPHLPLGTDTYILEAVLARLPAMLAEGADVVVLPMQQVGASIEHGDFPGTLSQRAEALIECWTALGYAVADAGLRKLAILNSHGGQPQIADIVAQRLRAGRKMLAVRINTFLLGVPDGLFAADELKSGFHGGEIETSMMLAIAPELVGMRAAKNFENRARAHRGRTLQTEGGAAFSWQAQDLNKEGATGNAAAADAKRGAALLDHIAARAAAALADMAAFPLSDLEDGPR